VLDINIGPVIVVVSGPGSVRFCSCSNDHSNGQSRQLGGRHILGEGRKEVVGEKEPAQVGCRLSCKKELLRQRRLWRRTGVDVVLNCRR
jgi:hypothetical protein